MRSITTYTTVHNVRFEQIALRSAVGKQIGAGLFSAMYLLLRGLGHL